MDTHANRPEDLNALERRLSAWQPTSAGLDVDAMLFAAGRASVRPSMARFVWPALTVVMTALSVVLGLGLADERSERLALAGLLQERLPTPAVSPLPPPVADTVGEELPSSDDLVPDSYLASRRALEKGLDAWQSRIVANNSSPTASPFTNPPVLRLGQRGVLLEP